MGKKKLAFLGETETKEKGKGKRKGQKKPKVVKTGKQHGRIADVGLQALEEAEIIKAKEEELAKELGKKAEEEAGAETEDKTKKKKKKKVRGKNYQEALKKIDREKLYPLSKAIKLLKKTSITQFEGSIDVHLNVLKSGLKGEIEFPFKTGKTLKIAIVDDKLLAKLAKNKIEFNLLICSPAMMPKLAKYARVLGPRGLMPNPKSGTITDKPEAKAKELAKKITFRTESKTPLIHLTIGKVNDQAKHLEANFITLINAVGKKNILKATLAPTMGPGIKVDLNSLEEEPGEESKEKSKTKKPKAKKKKK